MTEREEEAAEMNFVLLWWNGINYSKLLNITPVEIRIVVCKYHYFGLYNMHAKTHTHTQKQTPTVFCSHGRQQHTHRTLIWFHEYTSVCACVRACIFINIAIDFGISIIGELNQICPYASLSAIYSNTCFLPLTHSLFRLLCQWNQSQIKLSTNSSNQHWLSRSVLDL